MEAGETVAARLAEGDQASLPPSVRVGDSDLAVWPANQVVAPLSAPMMAITTFADAETYHPTLIAAALAAEPRLIIADEPISSLDVNIQERAWTSPIWYLP